MTSLENLQNILQKNHKIAIAFSGGTDSTWLLYIAKKMGADCHAFYVKSAFQPASELDDVRQLANDLHCPLSVIKIDTLADPGIACNPSERCYLCKKRIFTAMLEEASALGYSCLMDGTNASDDASDRPGMKALAELGIRSPLREAGMTKADIRQASREAGLPTADKPACACLATRIPHGEPLTKEKLIKVDSAEAFLKALGFHDLRVRCCDGHARIQIPLAQFEYLLKCRKEIAEKFSVWFKSSSLDLTPREN